MTGDKQMSSPPSQSGSASASSSADTLSELQYGYLDQPGSELIYPFHHANVHERRIAAKFFRAVPVLITVMMLAIAIVGAFRYPLLLECVAAVVNCWMWSWFVTYAACTLRGIWVCRRNVNNAASGTLSADRSLAEAESGASPIVHFIIYPNYKEDASIMAATLESLKQTSGSRDYRVMLAMEAREGEKAKERSGILEEQFGSCFTSMCTAFHPKNLTETHNDGSEIPEIPGKSSNLKWAIRCAHKQCVEQGVNLSSVIVTVADADCIFHANYFEEISRDFRGLQAGEGNKHQWTIWQGPQLPFRNYFASCAPSRIWGYISSCIEFGGVASLGLGGYHMTFSSFSLTLDLILKAKPWDGDVIADDHHCYLKCFLYSIHSQACEQMHTKGKCTGVYPALRVRPVMLPVKTTSVEDSNCKKSWMSRFNQATRHTQGVAEYCYIMLGVWDLLCTLPFRAYTCSLVCKLCRVVMIPFSINMLPIIHAIPFAMFALYWMWHLEEVPECPHTLWLQFDEKMFWLCAFSGAFNMVLPILVCFALLVIASYLMIDTAFLQQSDGKTKSDIVWKREDGGLPFTWGSRRLSLIGLILIDVVFLFPVVMPIYGFIPNVLAYWNVMLRGNRFKFVSAAKGVETPAPLPRVQEQLVQQANEQELKQVDEREVKRLEQQETTEAKDGVDYGADSGKQVVSI